MAPYKKRLEGIQATKELREIFKAAKRSAVVTSLSTTPKNDDGDHDYVPGRSLTVPQAAKLLRDFQLLDKNYFPIPIVRAMEVVLQQQQQQTHHGDNNTAPIKTHLLPKLDMAVRHSGLVFTPSPPNSNPDDVYCIESSANDDASLTPEERQYRLRIRRLRLQREQTKYSALTKNLSSMTHAVQDDGITTKSMTYAASIGLNMIVAPLSFGVFMYFFAGAVLDKFWPEPPRTAGSTTDIKRVIAGVVSGVVMLFIEMILFVIRTHEMEKALRRKQRKTGNQGPFSYYTATTLKTYKDR